MVALFDNFHIGKSNETLTDKLLIILGKIVNFLGPKMQKERWQVKQTGTFFGLLLVFVFSESEQRSQINNSSRSKNVDEFTDIVSLFCFFSWSSGKNALYSE
jgi:hypothetical protein